MKPHKTIYVKHVEVESDETYGYHPSNYRIVMVDELGDTYVASFTGRGTDLDSGREMDTGEALAELVVAHLGYEIDRKIPN